MIIIIHADFIQIGHKINLRSDHGNSADLIVGLGKQIA